MAFYKVTFHASLRFPIHHIIRRILYFYNNCPAQLIPSAWQSLICLVVVWWGHKLSLFLNEFRSLFTLHKNLKPNSGWLYFKARPSKTLLGGYPNNVKGWKKKNSLLSREMIGSSLWGYPGTLRFQEFRGHRASQVSLRLLSHSFNGQVRLLFSWLISFLLISSKHCNKTTRPIHDLANKSWRDLELTCKGGLLFNQRSSQL